METLMETKLFQNEHKGEKVSQEDECEINKWLEGECIFPLGQSISSPVSSPQSSLVSSPGMLDSNTQTTNGTPTLLTPPLLNNVAVQGSANGMNLFPSLQPTYMPLNFSSLPLSANGFNFTYSFPPFPSPSGTPSNPNSATTASHHLPPPMTLTSPGQATPLVSGAFALSQFPPPFGSNASLTPSVGSLPTQGLGTNFSHPPYLQFVAVNTTGLQPMVAPTGTKPVAPITSVADDSEEKRRRHQSTRGVARRVRQTRPKVVEGKGAIQCKGRNRKKNSQCRNAALMEFMGPRPIYCAEHIELDPKSLYEKCKAAYQKEPGDNKGCKEVVLKEFGLCYKHYPDLVEEFVRSRNVEKATKHHTRIIEILAQLEKEAAAAKKKDGDLYQRKNKLIPKFQEMKKIICKTLESFKSREDGLVLGISSSLPPSTETNHDPNSLYDVSQLNCSSSDEGTDDEEKQLEGDVLPPVSGDLDQNTKMTVGY